MSELDAILDKLRASLKKRTVAEGIRGLAIHFRICDRNDDGTISKSEFRGALPVLGFDATDHTAIDALFDVLDVDGSGSVEYGELAAKLDAR